MAIFSEIDGTNICPGLNYEELGATFNQALVFVFSYICRRQSCWEAHTAMLTVITFRVQRNVLSV